MTDHSSADTPRLIEGLLTVDDRGTVAFVNDFDFPGVRRFYLVDNHRAGFVRAWHAHKHEAKWATVVRGSAIVAAVKVDNWSDPSPQLQPSRFVMSASRPSVLYIPPGWANGFMSLTEDTRVMFLSSATIEESRADDYRYDARLWDVWQVIER